MKATHSPAAFAKGSGHGLTRTAAVGTVIAWAAFALSLVLCLDPRGDAFGMGSNPVLKYLPTMLMAASIPFLARGRAIRPGLLTRPLIAARSEEHTSELQSLMRISYAVFCLKKKK